MALRIVFLLALAQTLTGGRYANPLVIEKSRSVADPCVIRFEGRYYLFLTGGEAWASDDLVHWKHHPYTLPDRRRVSAPHAFVYRGQVWLTGNHIGLYRAPAPGGPWEYAGDFQDPSGKKMSLFDTTIFTDDDGRLYVYWSGAHTDGIYGAELNRENPTRFITAPKKLWTFDPSHRWERYGDNNEGGQVSWIEAPWMTKRNGTYYLQYSAPGTEWKTYAVGVYTSKQPLGPFRYAEKNPILVHRNGLINGVGHHTVIDGPDGNLWAIYTVLYRNHGVFDRRVGLDPVRFDARGNMSIEGPTEEPRDGPRAGVRPGVLPRDPGSNAVSWNRYSWNVSSFKPGREATYGFDNNVRTWWEPGDGDKTPSLTLDLGCRNPSDPVQEFIVDSIRLLTDVAPQAEQTLLAVDGHKGWYRRAAGGPPPASEPLHFRVEVSLDDNSYSTVAERTDGVPRNNDFLEFAPVRCRYIRLTLDRTKNRMPLAVLEWTVFGKSAAPAAVSSSAAR